MGKIDSDLCPLCARTTEKTIHLMSCAHEDIATVRGQMMERFRDTLNKLNTALEIINHWVNVLQLYNDGRPIAKPQVTINPTSWNIAQVHLTQAEMGWDCFFRGMIAAEWSKIQQKHHDRTEKKGENIYRWKRIVLQSIMDFIRELWKVESGYI